MSVSFSEVRTSKFACSRLQCFCVDEDLFENAPRVDADIFYTDKEDAFSKLSGYVWTGPHTSEETFSVPQEQSTC